MSNKSKEEYKKEYKKKYGEDLPDEVYDSPASKIRRKLNEFKAKILSDKDKAMDNKKAGGLMKYKKGGKVKRMSCPVDGMAKRGKTKVRRKGR